MKPFALLLPLSLAAASAGCFFGEPINQRPIAVIEPVRNEAVTVGSTVEFTAASSEDPDGDGLFFEWSARKCELSGACERSVGSGTQSRFEVAIDSKDPIEIRLTVSDSQGASAEAVTVVVAINRPPAVAVEISGLPSPNGEYTVGRELIATLERADDPDGDSVAVEWRLFPPKGSVPENVEFTRLADDRYRIVPDVPGVWRVEVVADDGDDDNNTADDDADTLVVADAPPCIELASPRVVEGAAYPLADGVRVLSVLDVVDELDPYPEPTTPQADDVRATEFRWLLRVGDGDFVPVQSGRRASLTVDSRDYAPGDTVDVRVEAADRVERTLPCGDDQDSCSIAGDGCRQRVTWKVALR